ncbi:hypothetical protein JCM3770_005070 [Rhodotorula araucariae]
MQSPAFSGWFIDLDLKGPHAGETHCGIYLNASSAERELREAGGNEAERAGVNFRIDVVTLAGAPLKQLEFTDRKLFVEHHGLGRKNGIAWSLIDELPDGRDSLFIRCALEGGECYKERRPAPLPPAVFNNPLPSDVTFHLTSTEPPARIFAMKPFLVNQSTYFATLFSSGFSEATSTIKLDAHLEYRKPDNAYAGNAADFKPFFVCKDPSALGSDHERVVDEDGDQDPATSPGLNEATAEPANEKSNQEVEMRKYHEIKVDYRRVYSTLHAFLFHLHYSKVAFVQSLSHHLALAVNATEESAYACIKGDAAKMADDPPPCSPHALYRLADRYLNEELKKQAKYNILNNLTIASAAYEAFGSLSRDYPELSDGVVAFILQHWPAVKATAGWARLEVLESGALLGGMAVLSKIHEGLVPKTT